VLHHDCCRGSCNISRTPGLGTYVGGENVTILLMAVTVKTVEEFEEKVPLG